MRTCAACGCKSWNCCRVDEIAYDYSEEVQQDYKERNYEDDEYICADCLNETAKCLEEFESNKV